MTVLAVIVGAAGIFGVKSYYEALQQATNSAKKQLEETMKAQVVEEFKNSKKLQKMMEEAVKSGIDEKYGKAVGRIESMVAPLNANYARLQANLIQAQRGVDQIEILQVVSRAQAHDRRAFDRIVVLGRSDPYYANIAKQIEMKYRQYAYFFIPDDAFNAGLTFPPTTNTNEFYEHLRSPELGTRLSALYGVRRLAEVPREVYEAILKHLDSETDLRGLAVAIGSLRDRLVGPGGAAVLDVEGTKKLWLERNQRIPVAGPR